MHSVHRFSFFFLSTSRIVWMKIPVLFFFLPLRLGNEQVLISPVDQKLERGRDTVAVMRDCAYAE